MGWTAPLRHRLCQDGDRCLNPIDREAVHAQVYQQIRTFHDRPTVGTTGIAGHHGRYGIIRGITGT